MKIKKPVLICIVGATAIGKTALAIKIAEAFSTEIISADSRQFYQEMEIGTAVPSTEELSAAKHHFIQNKSIFEAYSVGDFEREVIALLEHLFEKHQVVVLVGGSGLYVDAVTNGLDNFPKIDTSVRKRLKEEYTENGIGFIQKELEEVDVETFNKIDINNPQRVIRALEIFRGSKKKYSSFLQKNAEKRNFDTLFIGLTADREIIYDRINRRVDFMIENGLIEEAQNLYKHKELNALQTVGYRELFQFFDGTISKEEAISEIKKNTRRFAKRQSTWFRKNEAINWYNYNTNPKEIITQIKAKNTL